jgi:hypothetical protein
MPFPKWLVCLGFAFFLVWVSCVIALVIIFFTEAIERM